MENIIRKESELDSLIILDLIEWIENLTEQELIDATIYEHENNFSRDEKFEIREKVKNESQLQIMQPISEIENLGYAKGMPVIRYGEVFLVASPYNKGYLSIAKLTKGKKGHVVLHGIIQNSPVESFFKNNYFAIPKNIFY